VIRDDLERRALLRVKRLVELRAILVTGKGGVGKTTVAAALARLVAASGRRVLVTEIAHEDAKTSALGETLGVKQLTEQPVVVAPNLRVAALAPAAGHQRFLRDVLPMKILADAAMRTGAIRRFLSAAPTFPEMGVLYRLLDLVREKREGGGDDEVEHETIVVDLPATGHALALAQIPASLLRVIPSGPIAAAVREGLELLTDPARTGAVVVTLPETLPISEAIELAQGIEHHRIPLAGLLINRVPFNPFEGQEREIVQRLLEGRGHTLGERTLERIDRARAAIDRVTAGVRAPISVVQDVWLDGPRLVEEVASLLALDSSRVLRQVASP
jgi:anion-transporting  ArsA/GET3 family ATPase